MLKRRLSAISAMLLTSSLIVGILPAPHASAEANGTLVPYFNASLPVETRITDLLGRMTLDEKIGQMVQAERASVTPEDVQTYRLGSVLSGGGSFPNGKQSDSTREKWASLVDSYQAGALSTRLGIPLLYGVDAIHGNSNLVGATLFPHNIGLGAAGDPALVEQIGVATAQEIKAAGTNWAFAPTIADPQNIQWGRTYEGFGDNQELVAQMGAAFIKGLQGTTKDQLKNTDHVVATAKHFLGEGLTDNGTNQGNVSNMTEAEVLALDLPMYKAAVDAGVRTVMASYSSIQGLKMHANKRLLTDVLKGQLGFTGFVISDYNGVQQITKDWDGNAVSGLKNQIRVAVNAGVDMMMMPSDWKNTLSNLKALVTEGAITQARIDDAVKRILRVKFESGAFEHPMTDQSLSSTFGSADHRLLARDAVAKSLVLLKNDNVNGAPILSQLSNMSKIFVAGKSANDIGIQSGGWSITWQGAKGNTTPGTTILKGIQNAVGSTKTVTYNKGGRGAAGNDVAIAFIGETPYAEGSGDSLNSLKLDAEDLATLDNIKASGVPTIVVLVSGRPLMISDRLNDWAGLVEAWLPGTEGDGVADVLFGNKDFTGKLPVRWPFYTEAYTTPMAGQSDLDPKYVLFNYGYGLNKATETPALPAIPDKPGQQDPYVKVEAEDYIAQSGGLQAEDTSDVGKGKDIGYTSAGAWLEYMIDVPQSGTFDVDFRYAVNGDPTGLKMLDASGNELGTLSVTTTGGWQNWATKTVTGVPLTAGIQKIKLQFTGGNINLNWFGSKGFSPAPAQSGGGGGVVAPQTVVKEDAVESWISGERERANRNWYYAPLWKPGDEERQLTQQQENLDLTKVGNDADVPTIKINPNKTYQTVAGMGSSMEESTIFNITKMSDAKQTELLTKLVSQDQGIGMSMTRLTIGTADFTSRQFYTYDDMPAGETDPDLEHFSIQKDIDYGIIPVLQKIKAINPDMKFFASPWSPPGWMKTTDSMIKGQVKDEYLPVLADYYVKFIQAYKEQGIDISAMTLQNEPLLEIDYPSTKMPWQQEAALAKLLHEKLVAANLDVKLWIFDHNFNDTMNYPAPLLADPSNRAAIDGTAFHDYAGDPSSMTQLHDMYPDKNIYMTERAVWGTAGADRIAQYFRNWAKSYNSWVVMLDSDIATHQWVGTPDPTMVIQDSSNPDNYWLTPEYYLLGNFSKFVRPDDIRIDSNYGSATNNVTNVAFMSPDRKTIVTIVINQTDTAQTFKLVSDGTQIAATLPAKSVATYKWDRVIPETQHDPVTLDVSPQILAYDVNDKILTLKLTGGTFNENNLADITLGIEAEKMGITIGAVTLENPSEATIKLAWDQHTAYFVNTPLTVTVPVTAYVDSSNSDPLVGSVMLTGTGNHTDALSIAVPIAAVDYYQLSGVSADVANGKLLGFGTGRWADFKINVPTAGQYAVTLKVASPNGGGFLLQSGEGATLGSVVIPYLYNSGDWVGARTSIDLPAGEQTFRIYGSLGAFDLKQIDFSPIMPQGPGADGTIKVEAESFVTAGQQVIQYGSELNNLGYTVAGSTFDYLVNVPQAGYYKARLRYATAQGGVSSSILSNGQAKGSVVLPTTGGWGNYTEVYVVIQLDAGTQTIRIVDNGDGFNLDWLSLEPTNGTEVQVVKAPAPMASKSGTASSGADLVKLTSSVDGATIRYTLDGSLPTKDSAQYMNPIAVSSGRVIRAITVKAGMADSFVAFYAAPSAIVHLAGISLNKNTLELLAGDSYQLLVNIDPAEASNDGVTWTSSDASIASVDDYGKVTGLKIGKATITATTVEGSKTASVLVTVTSSGPTPTPAPTPSPSSSPAPVSGKVVLNPTTDANGVATATVKREDFNSAIRNTSNHTVTIDVKLADGTKEVDVDIPAPDLAADKSLKAIKVDMGIAVVTISTDVLGRNGASTAGTIRLSVKIVNATGLPADVQARLNGSPVYDFSLSIDGTKLSNFKGNEVQVSLPYTPKPGEKPNNIVIYYIDNAGKLEVVKNGIYNPSTGSVEFKAKHFSQYSAAYVKVTFSDMAKAAWAEDSIYALAARGSIEGTGKSMFNPTGNVTRAEFIQMLIGTFDLADLTATTTFTDVKEGAWYANAVASAQKLGIVNGKQDGAFGVNDRITREEMAVMIYRMGRYLNVPFTNNGDAAPFKDQAQLSAYAKDAVAATHGAGIISGKTDGNFAPKADATRAEAATIVFRLFHQTNSF
ncbi:carbohydrate-binding protein [Cohnella endophytica]|uniref:beta-glucosidase n=1 Tax=Cohnella endophytica TaxID=2419778 RepID=A0A494XV58_9BACL|nr:glycoside hydrolase family 3 N-terminal domain-containing protein [Cohnella endophytica]RKP54470.1 carbohydrate-binding protein [Cohnella endophytica]